MMPLTDALVGREAVPLATGDAVEPGPDPCRFALLFVAPVVLHAATLLLRFCSVSGCLVEAPLLTHGVLATGSRELSVTT